MHERGTNDEKVVFRTFDHSGLYNVFEALVLGVIQAKSVVPHADGMLDMQEPGHQSPCRSRVPVLMGLHMSRDLETEPLQVGARRHGPHGLAEHMLEERLLAVLPTRSKRHCRRRTSDVC